MIHNALVQVIVTRALKGTSEQGMSELLSADVVTNLAKGTTYILPCP